MKVQWVLIFAGRPFFDLCGLPRWGLAEHPIPAVVLMRPRCGRALAWNLVVVHVELSWDAGNIWKYQIEQG